MIIHTAALLSWMVISFTVGELFGSIFINTIILGVADALSNLLLTVVLRHCRRVVLLSFNFGGLGLVLLTSSVLRGFLFESTRTIDVALMIIGKFFASSKISTSFNFTKLKNFSWLCNGVLSDIRSFSHCGSNHQFWFLNNTQPCLYGLLQLRDVHWRRSTALGLAAYNGHSGSCFGICIIGFAGYATSDAVGDN